MNELSQYYENKESINAEQENATYLLHCPALAYLFSLGSDDSIRAMTSYLYKACLIMWGEEPRVIEASMSKEKERVLVASPWYLLNSDLINKLIHVLQASDARYSDRKLPSSSINTTLSAVKGVARQAKIKRIIDVDTYGDIEDIRSVKCCRINEGRALESEEINALLTNCMKDTSVRGVRDKAIILVLIGAGLRRSEIVGIKISDVNFTRSEIRIVSKGNKEALQPVNNQILDSIECWVEQARGDLPGPLFNRIIKNDEIQDKGLTSQAIYSILKERGLKSNLEKFTPHDLRRTYATWLLEGGENLEVVRDMMRHSSIQTTQKYRIVKRSDLHKAVAKLKLPI